jgi:hypothetical protein
VGSRFHLEVYNNLFSQKRSPICSRVHASGLAHPSQDFFSYLCCMPSQAAPSTFEELVHLVPPRGAITKHRFIHEDRPFELRIGRNSFNVVRLEFCVPDEAWTFWPCVRTAESLTTQRAVWSHWQKFLEDPNDYLTWKYIGQPYENGQKHRGNPSSSDPHKIK